MRSFLIVIALGLSACIATVRGGAVWDESPSRPPPPPQPHGGVIEGVITDAATHQPINEASIDIQSPPAVPKFTIQVGTDGHFATDPLPPGQFHLRVRRKGYETMQREVSVRAGQNHVEVGMRSTR
jgi:hypothetical protein